MENFLSLPEGERRALCTFQKILLRIPSKMGTREKDRKALTLADIHIAIVEFKSKRLTMSHLDNHR